MAEQTILFATNRNLKNAGASGLPDFGDHGVPFGSNSVRYGAATVDKISLTDPDAGRIKSVSQLASGSFSSADLDIVTKSKNDVVVFFHGAMNTFRDSIVRAAYNQEWMADLKIAGVKTSFDFIAFSWPARDYGLQVLSGYLDDQKEASRSFHHIGSFFRQLYALRAALDAQGRRMVLLAHSMGCYALAFAVHEWFRDPNVPNKSLFDEAILAAADVQAIAFVPPTGLLVDLHKLCREITIYYNNDDFLMKLSHTVNNGVVGGLFAKEPGYRLGYDGPPNTDDTNFFPPKVYEFIDCSNCNDLIGGGIDITHQYYRQSPTIRIDIATALAGKIPLRPKPDEYNCYIMFP